MKKLLTILTLFVATIGVTAQNCSQGRYVDEIFPTITTTSDIQYGSNLDKNGSNVNLLLDVYTPDGDALTDRALIIMAHGGSFIAGSKTGSDVVDLCSDLTKKGYVVASINYRLGMNGIPFPGADSADFTESVYRAVQDGRAAVRYFRKDFTENSNTFGIDTSQIYFGGVSAGGFIALHLAYLDDLAEFPSYVDTIGEPGLTGGLEGNSGNAGYSSKVSAIVNISGAMKDKSWATAGSTPCLSLHGNQDATVPYNTAMMYMSGIFEIMEVDGSASIASQLDAVGVINCYKQFNGADHVPHVSSAAYYDTTLTYMTGFLSQFTCGNTFDCSMGIISGFSAEITPTGPINACDSTVLYASSDSSYSYQWLRDGNIINGETDSFLVVTDSGSYTVSITDDNFVSELSDPVQVYLISSPTTPIILTQGPNSFCYSDSIRLDAGTGYTSYNWSTGDTSQVITVFSAGDYSVTVANQYGCADTGSYTIYDVAIPIPELCIVSVDSTSSKNMIIWEKPVSLAIDSFYVYKESSVAGVYDKIGSVDYDDFSTYIDNNSNPSVQANRYKLSMSDTCGRETLLGDYHKTIHLTISAGVNDQWNLIWNHYEGFLFNTYNIYRGTNASNMSLLASVASTINSYTDLTPPSGILYYQIEVVSPNGCSPNKTAYDNSRSNISDNGENTIGIETDRVNNSIRISPNPTTSTITLTNLLIGDEVSVYNTLGQRVYSSKVTAVTLSINLSELGNNGIYFVRVNNISERVLLGE
jgi:para-nitrobenzyl esterase